MLFSLSFRIYTLMTSEWDERFDEDTFIYIYKYIFLYSTSMCICWHIHVHIGCVRVFEYTIDVSYLHRHFSPKSPFFSFSLFRYKIVISKTPRNWIGIITNTNHSVNTVHCKWLRIKESISLKGLLKPQPKNLYKWVRMGKNDKRTATTLLYYFTGYEYEKYK